MYIVLYTPEFIELFHKVLSPEYQRKVRTMAEKQLPLNPFVGDQLKHKFFREKRLDEKRIYFLIYEEFHVVLLTYLSDKKQQQDIIDAILKDLDSYKEHIRRRVAAFPEQPVSDSF